MALLFFKNPKRDPRKRDLRDGRGDMKFDEACNSVDAFVSQPRSGAALPANAVSAFKESLRFANGKLVHANYSQLKAFLPAGELKALFATLGVSAADFDVYGHSQCVGSPPICFVGDGYCDPEGCIGG